MDSSKHPKYEEFKNRLLNRNIDLIKSVESLLISYWGSGDSEAQIKGYILSSQDNIGVARREIDLLDQLLSSDTKDEELVRLVLWSANKPLAVPDGMHARNWLLTKRNWLAEIVRY